MLSMNYKKSSQLLASDLYQSSGFNKGPYPKTKEYVKTLISREFESYNRTRFIMLKIKLWHRSIIASTAGSAAGM